MIVREYANAESSSRGTMVCATCGKPITSGRYAYYKKTKKHDWGYVTHHRACTETHPMWAKLDAEEALRSKRRILLRDACIDFRTKWGIAELDVYIDEITQERKP